MICTVCGMPFSYGGSLINSDPHERCREILSKQEERELRIDILLEMFAEDIDRRLIKVIR